MIDTWFQIKLVLATAGFQCTVIITNDDITLILDKNKLRVCEKVRPE